MIVVFLGPPGAGKGTQCKRIADRYGLKHLSSGDILRRERKEQTQLGRKAQAFMDAGKLVPDDLIVEMMSREINAGADGVVLDGFPRTLGQAKELDKALARMGGKVDVALNLEVDDEKLEERITGRRSCPTCGTAYHLKFNPPKKDQVCDKDATPLTQRSDDTSAVVRQRIATYHEQTAPLEAYYARQGNLHGIDGNANIDEVTQSLYEALDPLANCGKR